ncbi:MAG TPA: DUF2752 domain-containing protein [Planctomycetes bacterium]|nr:DUF2752 domain-containing protein [Planctomycetota bacterium]
MSLTPVMAMLSGASGLTDAKASDITPPRRMIAYQRAGLLGLALGLCVPLVVAGLLVPDPRGYGTHEQLGLPPCSATVLFGGRCPTCGMTTAWAWLVRLRICEALRANVGGVLLGLATAVSIPWLVLSALRGRWFLWVPNGGQVFVASVVFLGVTFLDWLIRLVIGLS